LDFLERKAEASNRRCIPWLLGTFFSHPSTPGTVYIECDDPQDICRVFQHVHVLSTVRPITLVSPNEFVELINTPNLKNTVSEGTWVRIKKGKYQGDAGYVASLRKDQKALVLLVPRIHYQEGPVWTRPPQDLFRVDLARTVFGEKAVKHLANNTFQFQEEIFEDGLLARYFRHGALEAETAFPLPEEIELFDQSPRWDARARADWEAGVFAAALYIDDWVEILEGELQGTVARITRKNNDGIEVQPYFYNMDQNPFDEHFRVTLPPRHVRRNFKVGNFIRVRCGDHAGKYGYIVNMLDDRTLEFTEWDQSKPYAQVC
jgi:transcription elongation factor SPT5